MPTKRLKFTTGNINVSLPNKAWARQFVRFMTEDKYKEMREALDRAMAEIYDDLPTLEDVLKKSKSPSS